MNGPSKDAGVERIARLEKRLRADVNRLRRAAGYAVHFGTPTADSDRRYNSHFADDIEAVLALLPHPAVDPAAEEVAGRLEEAETKLIDSVPPGLQPDEWDEPPFTLYGEAATLIRSQSARIAELEGALKPFAEAAEHLHPSQPDDGLTLDAIMVKDWRAAYAAYHGSQP